MVDRRGFFASLGALAAATLIPTSGAGLVEASGVATATEAAPWMWMTPVPYPLEFFKERYFADLHEGYTPLLDDLDAEPGWEMP